jgi:hypothetical protein
MVEFEIVPTNIIFFKKMFDIADQKSNWVDYPLNLQSFYKNLVKHIAIEGVDSSLDYGTPIN